MYGPQLTFQQIDGSVRSVFQRPLTTRAYSRFHQAGFDVHSVLGPGAYRLIPHRATELQKLATVLNGKG